MAATVETPFYCYSQSAIESAYNEYSNNLKTLNSMICYAVKANSNQAIIKTLAGIGAGADVVSEGELRRALQAGVPPSKIVFSGVAKSEREMSYALSVGIFQFNVESENELERLNQTALNLNKVARIAFRINPDVDANTHAKISTGKSENKFGIPISKAVSIYNKAAKMRGIEVKGVDVHIGSQLTTLAPFRETFKRIKLLVNELLEQGIAIEVIDIGGGLGVNYENQDNFEISIKRYCEMVNQEFCNLNAKIILEPGRSLVANSGLLVSQVVYKKQGEHSTFLIIDAAMNDLLRPSMYDAHHDLLSVTKKSTKEHYDIVGPICETGDTFAKNRQMESMEEGELLAIANVGAYGAVMSSNYNTRLSIPEVLVHQSQFEVIKPRRDYEALLSLDNLASWQQTTSELELVK